MQVFQVFIEGGTSGAGGVHVRMRLAAGGGTGAVSLPGMAVDVHRRRGAWLACALVAAGRTREQWEGRLVANRWQTQPMEVGKLTGLGGVRLYG